MVAIPSGIPIPAPMAVDKLAECSWSWTGAAEFVAKWVDCAKVWEDRRGSVDVLANEGAVTVIVCESAPV